MPGTLPLTLKVKVPVPELLANAPTVQPFPSSQASALLACVHPATASHPSVVHGLASSHDVGEPPQAPFAQGVDVASFFAQGPIDQARLVWFTTRLGVTSFEGQCELAVENAERLDLLRLAPAGGRGGLPQRLGDALS